MSKKIKNRKGIFMSGETYLIEWEVEKDRVRMTYNDGETIYVSKSDFDRAFGAILNASKEDVIRDFAIN